MYVYLSHKYAIRNELNCSYFIKVESTTDNEGGSFGSFCIPPFMGYILAHIGDLEYDSSLAKIADNIGIGKDSVKNFVNQLIDNTQPKNFILGENFSIILPSCLLCKADNKQKSNVFEIASYSPENDFYIKRPTMPLSVNLMITTKCTTDCIYCYANRSLSPIMDTGTILDVIQQLYRGGTINITLTGGDIFTRSDWKIILKKLKDLGYSPYISTKTPISENDIIFLKQLQYNEIQFSLDSNNETTLTKMVKPPLNYLSKVKEFLNNAGKLGMKVLIRTVLTSFNSDIEQIRDFYEFLSSHDAIKSWDLTPAFFSKYKSSFYKKMAVCNDNLKQVYNFTKREDLVFSPGLNKIGPEGYVLKKHDNVDEFVHKNQTCMANTTSLSILANGDCSVCEMLYDDEEFLLGNIHSNSIEEIWNSPKALSLYSLKQENVCKGSPCKTCNVFEECRNKHGKKICYLDITKTGKKLDYPDPRCPKSDDYNIIF